MIKFTSSVKLSNQTIQKPNSAMHLICKLIHIMFLEYEGNQTF